MARQTLAEELKSLINPNPISEDIENENDTSTLATKIYEVNLNDENQSDENSFSQIRRNQVLKLSSFNERYAGKKIERQELVEDFQKEGFNENENDQDKDDESYSGDEENQLDHCSQESYEVENQQITIDKNRALNILNDYNNELQLKAISVKNQLAIYESLIGIRIKLQKLLNISNRLSPKSNLYLLKDEKNKTLLSQSSRGLQKLQKLFLEINKFIGCKQDEGEEQENPKKNKRKTSDIQQESSASKRFCLLKEYYSEVIDEWHEKTKFVHSNLNLKKFESFDVRPSKIIEHILMDKERLINRTKIRRSQYNVIGEANLVNQDDEQIYDDDDFYHIILQQIIENKSNVSRDLLSSSKKLAEIQRLRSKSKKKIDTKASKGRKIRYDVHEKLVNFMAPLDKTTFEEEAKNDLFKSLFGNFFVESEDLNA